MPATAFAAKNTKSGPSSMMSFDQTPCSETVAAFSLAIFRSGCRFILAIRSRYRAREVLRAERLEIVDAFADADGVDGNLKALSDGDQDAAPRRAVELGDDEAGDACDFLEDLDLRKRILTRGGVEHEDDAVRRGLVDLLQDANDLGELGHEVRLVLQAPRRVDEEHVEAFRPRPLERLEGDAGGIGAHRLRHDLGADPLAPDLELIDRGGAERVGGREHDLQVLAIEPVRELGCGRGLAGAVDADNEKDMGALARRKLDRLRPGRKHACDLRGDDLAHGLWRKSPLVAALRQPLANARRHPDAEIGLDQGLLDPVERLLIELALGERAGKSVGEGIGGAGEPAAKLIEPAPLGLRPLPFAHDGTAISAAPSSPATTASTNVPALAPASTRTGVKSAARPRAPFSIKTEMRRPLAAWR